MERVIQVQDITESYVYFLRRMQISTIPPNTRYLESRFDPLGVTVFGSWDETTGILEAGVADGDQGCTEQFECKTLKEAMGKMATLASEWADTTGSCSE